MQRLVVYALALVVGVGFSLIGLRLRHAQEDHAQGHAHYQNRVKKNDTGCCNNQDCGQLKSEDERITGLGIEVRIEGEWCPVQTHHYLKKGNAPDWSTSHVCVEKGNPFTETLS